MNSAITTIFCHIADFLKAISWEEDNQCQMSHAEVITTGLTAMRYFGGNLESARSFLKEHGYIPEMLSKSRLNRRLHAIPTFFWNFVIENLASMIDPDSRCFLVDSFPVSVCHNVRGLRRSICREKAYVGYNASKKSWYIGLKVHLVVTHTGQPKECLITPASTHDLKALKQIYLGTLPRLSTVFGDKAYQSKEYENELLSKGILLSSERKRNSKRGQSLIYQRYGKRMRKRIETVFSQITSWLPRHLHAVTEKGIALKLMMLITAFSFTFLG